MLRLRSLVFPGDIDAVPTISACSARLVHKGDRRPALKEIGPNMSSRTDRLTVAAVGGVIGGAAALALAAHYQTL